MSNQPFLATIKGIPALPYVNVRKGPGTSHAKVFQVDVGKSGLTVLEAAPDDEGKNFNGKVYQWLRLTFDDDSTGWVRDDLVEVQGDGSPLGYGVVEKRTLAHSLTRKDIIAPGQETIRPQTSPKKQTQPAPAKARPAPQKSAPDKGEARLMSMGKNGVNVRSGPGTGHNPPYFRLPYRETARILDTAPGEGDPFTWIKIDYEGRQGWIREDYTRLVSGFEAFGLGYEDAYPAPTDGSWWVRDFNLDPEFATVHHGWDLGGPIGEPILAGPKGGYVVRTAHCKKCGPQGASSYPNFPISDKRVLTDPDWNFGYGHFLIVRYDHDRLPPSTRKQLAQKGYDGAHLFVMYAHLAGIDVQENQDVDAEQHIARLGNSGNSSGAHLHLEVRASKKQNARWAEIKSGLMTPGVLFLR